MASRQPAVRAAPAALGAALRTLVVVAGGFGLVSLAVMLGAALLARGVLQPSDAVVASAMFGFLLYLGWLLWALACPSLGRLAMVLCGAALLLAGLGRAAGLHTLGGT